MMPPPMMRQSRKPAAKPIQTWCVSVKGSWGVMMILLATDERRGLGIAADTYLPHEFLVNGGIAVRPVEGLLEKGEKDGDDNRGLDGLAEDNEEDGDGEDVGCHACECL
jgi:hypothetical protein